jgi:DNA-binding GntR family transcriptional regulator
VATERSIEIDAPLVGITKARAVFSELRRKILTGELPPGHEVNQEAMAAGLGVSITPLREALRRLEMEGLVRLKAHRTVVIPPLTRDELVELYVIRTELDPLATRLTTEVATDEETALIAKLARQKLARDPVVQLELNRTFHRAIYAACGNSSLITYLDQLWDRTDRYRLILVKQEFHEGPASPTDHIEIADAIVARDAEKAGQLMRAHIAGSRHRIADAIDRPLDGPDAVFARKQ